MGWPPLFQWKRHATLLCPTPHIPTHFLDCSWLYLVSPSFLGFGTSWHEVTTYSAISTHNTFHCFPIGASVTCPGLSLSESHKPKFKQVRKAVCRQNTNAAMLAKGSSHKDFKARMGGRGSRAKGTQPGTQPWEQAGEIYVLEAGAVGAVRPSLAAASKCGSPRHTPAPNHIRPRQWASGSRSCNSSHCGAHCAVLRASFCWRRRSAVASMRRCQAPLMAPMAPGWAFI